MRPLQAILHDAIDAFADIGRGVGGVVSCYVEFKAFLAAQKRPAEKSPQEAELVSEEKSEAIATTDQNQADPIAY